MSAHTAGPWLFEDYDSGDDSVGMQATPPYIYSDPDGDGNAYPICTLDQPMRQADRAPANEYDDCMESAGTYKANAALICAAPDLLAALQGLLDPATNEDGEWYRQARAAARAAVAKATQGSPK